MSMLLDNYQAQELLFNANLTEKSSSGETYAYRGDWVLVEGEAADDLGRKKPPLATMKEAVLLVENDKIKFACGFIDELDLLPVFVEKYGADFAPGLLSILYVANIAKAAQVEYQGVLYVLIPLTEGMVWNELIEEMGMEKGDFKGLSAADKVVALYNEVKGYKPRYESLTLEALAAKTTSAKRATHGAV
jgi:hypothetical protein